MPPQEALSFVASTLWVKKLDPYSFEHNFCKYCPILILFFYCCRHKLSAQKHIIEFPTSPIVCCCTTLQNASAYTSSQKLLNQSAIHAVISLLSQSRKFWWHLLLTFSMLLYDVIMTSYCCQRYAECLVTTLCSSRTVHYTPRRARATVELLRQETPNFFAPNLWPPSSPDLSLVDCEIWVVMRHRACLPQKNP